MEQCDNSAFKLSSTAGVDGGWAKRLPDNALTDVGGDEKGDSWAETVSFLKKLVKADNNDSGKEELEDDEDGVSNTKLTNGAIHSGKNVCNRLTDGNQNTKKLLSTIPTKQVE